MRGLSKPRLRKTSTRCELPLTAMTPIRCQGRHLPMVPSARVSCSARPSDRACTRTPSRTWTETTSSREGTNTTRTCRPWTSQRASSSSSPSRTKSSMLRNRLRCSECRVAAASTATSLTTPTTMATQPTNCRTRTRVSAWRGHPAITTRRRTAGRI